MLTKKEKTTPNKKELLDVVEDTTSKKKKQYPLSVVIVLAVLGLILLAVFLMFIILILPFVSFCLPFYMYFSYKIEQDYNKTSNERKLNLDKEYQDYSYNLIKLQKNKEIEILKIKDNG